MARLGRGTPQQAKRWQGYVEIPSGDIYTDSAEVYLTLSALGTEEQTNVDAATVVLDLQPSGVEEAQFVDTGTVDLRFTPSALEERQQYDAATAVLLFTPSGTEVHGKEYTDANTIPLLFSVSGAEERTSTDAATANVVLTPSALEERQQFDAATARLSFVPSGIDVAAYLDSNTLYLDLQPSGTEQLVVIPLVPYYPYAVQGPTLSSNLYVWISWARNDRTATSYKIYKDNSLLTTVDVTGEAWDKCAFKDTSVSAGNTYEYEVVAVNAVGESDRSQIASITVRSDAQIGATVNVDSQTGPSDREKINQAITAAKAAGGGIVQFGNSTYTLGSLASNADILLSSCKNVVVRGHSSGGTKINTTDDGDTSNNAATERLIRVLGGPTTLSAVLVEKIDEGDTEAVFDDVAWAVVGRKVSFDQGLSNGIGSIATQNGVTMDPGTPRDNARSYDINEIVSINSGTDTITFKYPFSAEFVIDSVELNGRALPTIRQFGDHGGCGFENITIEGKSTQATDGTNYLVHAKLDDIPDFFFAECTFKWANKSFVLHDDAGYVNYVGCEFHEQGAIADNPSSSAVYSLNLQHAPNCFVIDCDFGLGFNPVVPTFLTSGGSDANQTSYTTASITPSANKLILLTVLRNDDTLTTSPTITGNGLTWELEEVVTYDNAGGIRADLRVYRAMGASPTAGTITIDYGADGQLGCQWSVSEFDGVDTSGTNGSGAIVQSVTAQGTGTGLTATLAAFNRRSHATFAAFAHQAVESTTFGSGFTELSDTNYTNPPENLQTQWRNDNDTNADASWATSVLAGAIGIELRATTANINRKSHVALNEGAHRTVIRHSRFYDTTSYCVNTHGFGVADWVVENSYFEPTPIVQRGSIFVGNSSWGFDHQGIVRNNRAVSGPRFIYGQENTYEIRVIANKTSGLTANSFVSTPCVVEAYGWDGPDTTSGLTGSLRWTIRENTDIGLSSSHVRLEQIESSTYPTDGAGGGPSSGSWARDVVHDSNSWNNTTDIVTPANIERIPYDTSGGFPTWSAEVFQWQIVIEPLDYTDAATVLLKFTPSGTELAETVDTATVNFNFTPSGTEQQLSQDANTVLLQYTPSGIDTAQYVDAVATYLYLTPSGDEFKGGGTEDADTTYLDLIPSGVEFAELTESTTVNFKFTPSGTEFQSKEYIDANTATLAFTPSGTEFTTREYTDADTARVTFVPSGVDTAQYVDTGTTYLALIPSGTEFIAGNTEDTGTIYLDLQANSTEFSESTDLATVRLTFTPQAVEGLTTQDAATGLLRFTPSSTDTAQYVDAATAIVRFTPFGTESISGVGTDEGTVYLLFTPSGEELRAVLNYELRGSLSRHWRAPILARVYEGLPGRHFFARLEK